MRKIKQLLGKIICKFSSAKNYLKKEYYKSLLKNCGKDVYLGNDGIATYQNISIGNHVYIGSKYVLQSAHGEIEIGNHVMFGPGVHIHGGNHVFDQVGVYMDMVKKTEGSDGKVVIEDDVWIGANAMIVGGVRIAFGSIIGAGAVVTHDTEVCGIYAGVPAKLIGKRFVDEKEQKHKESLLRKEIVDGK